MAAPATVDEFLDLVRKSNVVDETRLAGVLDTLSANGDVPHQTQELANRLVRNGILTHFQARQLLAGKWRRFVIGSKYKLLELLGAGGMGAVYLCEHVFMRRLVALKVLPADKIQDPSAVERFYREARATAALDHPNIVRSFDIDQIDNLHFLVMEFIDGSSLHEVVARGGPMEPVLAAHCIAQAARGLQHAHEAGLVHRDIKPGNLLMDRNGTIKILDLGLARFFDAREQSVTEKYDERTVLGTADYLAPEQALRSAVDIRADIYSLGATLYFLLSGRAPFQDGTIAQKLVWHQMREPTPIRELRPEVPEALAAVMRKMMAKDPKERYQQPSEVAEALAEFTKQPVPPPNEELMPKLCPAVLAAGKQAEPGTGSYTAMPASRVTPVPHTGRSLRPGSSPEVKTASATLSRKAGTRAAALTPNDLTEGPPDTIALPKPGSEDERQMLLAAGLLKNETQKPTSKRSAILLGAAAGAMMLLIGGAVAYMIMPGTVPNTPPVVKSDAPITVAKAGPITPTDQPPTPPADPSNAPLITPDEALRHSGKVCTVEMSVLSIGSTTLSSGLNVFLNSSRNPMAKNYFTAMLLPEVLHKYAELNQDPKTLFDGKKIRVHGEIVLYKGKPEIKVSDPKQIKIVGDAETKK